ncbi:G8 domain-containing protein [uncultured Aquimarina sp.]|uniref:G8 domain-containing protein n=1 Tax=uncultured Aquimarina sp. TaxID=575652 RepID=UPI00260B75D6|nr:G8 domain-containing protein [uncultured Aquimarina sp.]
MTKKYSLWGFLLMCIFLCFPTHLFSQNYWSNPSSWPSGRVPQANENIVIPSETTMILDVNTAKLGDLTINGQLIFKDVDVSLTAKVILVKGLLQIGTVDTPFQNNATITLTGPKVDEPGFGGRFLSTVSGGSLQIHGASRSKLSWGQLIETVAPGDTKITLDKDPVGWKVGDVIAIAPSGYEPYEAEEVTISELSGRIISFTPALQYPHFGEIQEYEGKILDERAEVGMLTRNIIIQGAEDSVTQKYGGHIMIMGGSGSIQVEGVEFTKLGQPGLEARYNFHWHLAGDRTGDYLKNSSIHHSLQRAVVAHQTDNVWVENIVAFNIQNHAFIPAEDGNEINNTFIGNLAMLIRKPDEGLFAFPRDGNGGSTQGEQRVAGFWMRNPHNNLISNHVAGSERGTGFFFDARGRSREFREYDLLPREIVFDDNLAHSCSVPGNLGNEGVSNHALYGQVGHGHGFFMTGDFQNGDLMWEFSNFTSYKNAMSGVWTEITNVTLDNFISADNAIGLLSSESYVQNSIVVGRSNNDIGGPNRNLRHGHKRAGYYSVSQGGSKQPKFSNVTFIDINKDIEEGVAAAVVGHGGHRGENYFERIKIINSTPMYMDSAGSNGRNANSSFLLDKDGSLTGYNRPVLIVHPYSSFVKDAIEHKEDWNAYIVDAQNAMELKMNRVGFDLPLDLSLIRDNDGLRIPKMQWAHQRFFRFFGNQKYTLYGQWDIDDAGQSLELLSAMKKEGEWTILKHPFPYEGIIVENREEQSINKVTSLSDLESQTTTSYYFDKNNGAVHVKMITKEDGKDWLLMIPVGQRNGPNYGVDSDDLERYIINMVVYPNPLNSNSVLEYTLLQDQLVSITMYDMLGRKVRKIISEEQEAGIHSIPLDNIPVQSGLYALNIELLEASTEIKVIKQ